MNDVFWGTRVNICSLNLPLYNILDIARLVQDVWLRPTPIILSSMKFKF